MCQNSTSKSLKIAELYPPVVFGKETSYSCGPGYRRHPVTCRLLVSQKAFPQRDVLSCAEDRTGQEAPPVDSCVHSFTREPRLLPGQNTCSGATVGACTRMYTLETRGPFLRSYSLENLKMPWKMLPDSARRRKREKSKKVKVFTLLEVYLRRTTGGFPSPVGTAIGDVLLLWTRQ